MNDKISGAQKKRICKVLGVEREQLDLRLGEAGRAFTEFRKKQKAGTLD